METGAISTISGESPARSTATTAGVPTNRLLGAVSTVCSSLYNYINGGTPHIPSHTASDSHRGTMNMEDVGRGCTETMDEDAQREVNDTHLHIAREGGSTAHFLFLS